MRQTQWYEQHDNLTFLARWLDDECAEFPDISTCLYYFEKPWKWTREWNLLQLYLKADTDEQRQAVIDGVFENKTASEVQADWEELEVTGDDTQR